MVRVTDTAMDCLEAIRDANELLPDEAVSLVANPAGGLAFGIMRPAPGDQIIARDGRPVMAVPQDLADSLETLVIDYQAEGEDEGFVLRQEEAASGQE